MSRQFGICGGEMGLRMGRSGSTTGTARSGVKSCGIMRRCTHRSVISGYIRQDKEWQLTAYYLPAAKTGMERTLVLPCKERPGLSASDDIIERFRTLSVGHDGIDPL